MVVVTRLVKRATKPQLASKDILKHLRFVLCGSKTLEDRICLRRWSGLVHVKDQSARGQKRRAKVFRAKPLLAQCVVVIKEK